MALVLEKYIGEYYDIGDEVLKSEFGRFLLVSYIYQLDNPVFNPFPKDYKPYLIITTLQYELSEPKHDIENIMIIDIATKHNLEYAKKHAKYLIEKLSPDNKYKNFPINERETDLSITDILVTNTDTVNIATEQAIKEAIKLALNHELL